jgi:hypothetical protein
VDIHPGQALVFGRIRMFDATQEKVEYSPFWFEPWGQPFFAPGPRMTLEFRQIFPPGGVFRYKSYPAPPIEKDGSFFRGLSKLREPFAAIPEPVVTEYMRTE